MKLKLTFFNFFKEVYEELRKVTFPTRNKVFRNTLLVILAIVILTILLGAIDLGIVELLKRFVIRS